MDLAAELEDGKEPCTDANQAPGAVSRWIDVIRGRIVDIGEAIPRRRIQRVGHQAVGLGELADGRVIKTRPVVPLAMLRGGCALVQAESPVRVLTDEQAVGQGRRHTEPVDPLMTLKCAESADWHTFF
jgi:hypothetical protein